MKVELDAKDGELAAKDDVIASMDGEFAAKEDDFSPIKTKAKDDDAWDGSKAL